LGRHPNQVAQVRGRGHDNAADPAKRHPIIFASKDQFEHRSKSRIGVRNPGKRFAVERAGGLRRRFEGTVTQFSGGRKLAPDDVLGSLDQQTNPFERLSEDQGRKLALEHAAPQRFTVDNRLEYLREEHGVRIDSRDHLQLDQAFGPVAEHTMELEEKKAQLGIFGTGTNLVLQFHQGLIRLAGGEKFLGRHWLWFETERILTTKIGWRLTFRTLQDAVART
jgi:hypothetical protein